MMDLKYKVLEYVGLVNVFIASYNFYDKILNDRDGSILFPVIVGSGCVVFSRYLKNNSKYKDLEDKLDNSRKI